MRLAVVIASNYQSSQLAPLLAAPLDTIYVAGASAYVFVKEGESIKERKVTLGASSETHIQIAEGVEENEQVLRLQAGQGRELLMKAGIKVDEATSRPSFGKRRTGGGAGGGSRGGGNAPAPAGGSEPVTFLW